MGWTKQQLVEQAFEEIGMASYVFDLQVEQLQSAMYKLDAMMAEWHAFGVRLGYPISSSQSDASLSTDTSVKNSALQAIRTNLAILLAPSYGKTVSVETKIAAKNSYNTLLRIAARPIEMQFPSTTPLGAGAKSYDQPFMPIPTEPQVDGQNFSIFE